MKNQRIQHFFLETKLYVKDFNLATKEAEGNIYIHIYINKDLKKAN